MGHKGPLTKGLGALGPWGHERTCNQSINQVPVYAVSLIYELCFVVKCSGSWCFNFLCVWVVNVQFASISFS